MTKRRDLPERERIADSREYIDAYRRQPETALERAEAMCLAIPALAEQEWDAAR